MVDQELSEYWYSQVVAWQASGLSCRAFCDQQNLVYHRFAYWRKKYQTREPPSPKGHAKKGGFTQVVMAASTQNPPAKNSLPDSQSLTVTLPNGIAISGLQASNIAWLGALLEQLR